MKWAGGMSVTVRLIFPIMDWCVTLIPGGRSPAEKLTLITQELHQMNMAGGVWKMVRLISVLTALHPTSMDGSTWTAEKLTLALPALLKMKTDGGISRTDFLIFLLPETMWMASALTMFPTAESSAATSTCHRHPSFCRTAVTTCPPQISDWKLSK